MTRQASEPGKPDHPPPQGGGKAPSPRRGLASKAFNAAARGALVSSLKVGGYALASTSAGAAIASTPWIATAAAVVTGAAAAYSAGSFIYSYGKLLAADYTAARGQKDRPRILDWQRAKKARIGLRGGVAAVAVLSSVSGGIALSAAASGLGAFLWSYGASYAQDRKDARQSGAKARLFDGARAKKARAAGLIGAAGGAFGSWLFTHTDFGKEAVGTVKGVLGKAFNAVASYAAGPAPAPQPSVSLPPDMPPVNIDTPDTMAPEPAPPQQPPVPDVVPVVDAHAEFRAAVAAMDNAPKGLKEALGYSQPKDAAHAVLRVRGMAWEDRLAWAKRLAQQGLESGDTRAGRFLKDLSALKGDPFSTRGAAPRANVFRMPVMPVPPSPAAPPAMIPTPAEEGLKIKAPHIPKGPKFALKLEMPEGYKPPGPLPTPQMPPVPGPQLSLDMADTRLPFDAPARMELTPPAGVSAAAPAHAAPELRAKLNVGRGFGTAAACFVSGLDGSGPVRARCEIYNPTLRALDGVTCADAKNPAVTAKVILGDKGSVSVLPTEEFVHGKAKGFRHSPVLSRCVKDLIRARAPSSP